MAWSMCHFLMAMRHLTKRRLWRTLSSNKRFEYYHTLPIIAPDLAPCDFLFLFPRLKYILAGKRYASRKDLCSAVGQCLRHIPASVYEKYFNNWIKRLKLCVKAKGEYFEWMHWTFFRRKLSKLDFDLHFCIMTSVWDFSNPPFYWMIS